MEPYIGEIRIFAGNYPPVDWAYCEGQLLLVAAYQPLFAILGARYGGDGKTNFALPDLRGKAPMGQGTGGGLTPRTLGQSPGSPTVALSTQQIPSHSHVPNCFAGGGSQTSPEAAIWAGAGRMGVYATSSPNDALAANQLQVVGGSQPHENRQPFLGIHYIISLRGIWPARP